MFSIELKSCPDQERLGVYDFYFPKIIISRRLSECHLYLPDLSIKDLSLLVIQKADGIEVHERSSGFYVSNGKKISGKKIHRVGDTFGIGNSVFQVTSVLPEDTEVDTEARYHELTEAYPYMADLFWALKQELLNLEQDGSD